MKKSFGKKLLAGIVSASMILGIPVAGYSQEEDLSQLVIAQEETAEVTEEVLAGAGEVEVAAVETPADVAAVEETEVFSEVVAEVQEDLAEDAPAEDEEEFLIAADEEPEDSEEIPEDGILLETEAEEETLEAADGVITLVGTITEFEEAILQAKEGDTIRLTADMSYLGSSFHIDKNTLKDATSVTIDLNKKTLTFGSSFWFYVEDGKKLTITNGTLQGSLNVQGAEVNISSDATVTESYCLKISDGGVVNVNGGSLVSSGGTSTVAVDVYDGTLNMKEEEEPRVLADRVIALPVASELNDFVLPESHQPVTRKSVRTPQKPVQKPIQGNTLYLRVPSLDSKEYHKAKNILEIFNGNTRVIFYLSDTKQQLLAPHSLWTAPNPTMMGELCYQLGEKNVILK